MTRVVVTIIIIVETVIVLITIKKGGYRMKRLFLFFTVLSVFLLSSCVIPSRQEKMESAKNTEASVGTTEKEKGMYKKISAKEAYDMMSVGGVTVVDVRTKAEYDEGHIKGAVLVPNETIVNNAPSELQDKQPSCLFTVEAGGEATTQQINF